MRYLPRMRVAATLLLALVYHVTCAQAELEETDDAFDDLAGPTRLQAVKHLGLAEWAAILGVGTLGAGVIGSTVAHRRNGAAAAAPGPTPPDDARAVRAPRDPRRVARETESRRVAPRWAVASASESDWLVVLELRNAGVGNALRVRTLGLGTGVGVRPACASDASRSNAGADARAGDTLVFTLIGRPARAAFHFSYEDDAGFTWWCPVEYAGGASPSASVGRMEREHRA